MTRAKTIAECIRLLGHLPAAQRSTTKEIRRHYNTPADKRGFKWTFGLDRFLREAGPGQFFQLQLEPR